MNYCRSSNTASRLVANEAVIVLLPQGEMNVLNETGTLIWSLADGTRTMDEIAAAVKDVCHLSETPEIEPFLEALLEQKLLEKTDKQATVSFAAPQITEYAAPATRAKELLETLAGLCNSTYGGIYADCQTWPACLDPWD